MDLQKYVVVAIMVAVYLLMTIVKPLLKEEHKKYIPLFSGVVGIILNIWFSGSFTFDVFLTGLASGLSATGIDQGVKSLTIKPSVTE